MKLILAVGRFLIDQLGKNESTMIKERVAAKLDLASMVDRLVRYTDTVRTKSGKVYRDLESLLCRLILTYDPGLGVKSSEGGVCTNKAYKTLRNAPDSEETPKRKYFVEVADMVNRFIEVYLVKKTRRTSILSTVLTILSRNTVRVWRRLNITPVHLRIRQMILKEIRHE